MVRVKCLSTAKYRFQVTDTEPSLYSIVLDLPQLYTRPSSTELLSALAQLSIQPTSWDAPENWQEHDDGAIGEDGVPKYLTGIIASPLAWIEDERIKDQIWEAAGARLSERSGRTGALTSTSSDILQILSTYVEA